MLIPDSDVVDVNGISEEDKQRIMAFLQGAVYCWCKHNREEWFSLRTFSGGENYNWQGTPLYVLFEKHRKNMGNDEATCVRGAGLDAGAILKKVLREDRRVFETRYDERSREYHWIGAEQNV